MATATAPRQRAPRPAPQPSRRPPRLRSRLARFWHQYTRMRTAIYMLMGVLGIVLIGTFVPQQFSSSQGKVSEFLGSHAALNDLASHLGLPLTSVFVSPLFYILLGSIYVALLSCVLTRGRALIVRTVRGYPRSPQYWGEWGSWLFHTSFFLLLVAVVWGKATGFDGIMTITEGQRVAETRASYDTLQEGMLFDGRHSGYEVQLNRFAAPLQANGMPEDFVSNVTVYDAGRPVVTKDVRVNDFLGYDNVDFYQQDYGWAPHIVVKNPSGEVVSDSAAQLISDDKTASTGVIKVPDFNYRMPGQSKPTQIGARLVLYPDAQALPSVGGAGNALNLTYGPGSAAPNNPVLQVQLFVGDLGINGGASQDVFSLDTTGMTPYYQNAAAFALPLHQSVTLQLPAANNGTANFTIAFADLKQFSLFHVKKDSGVPLVYATFVLTMVGLLTKLYLRPFLERRRRARRATLVPAAVTRSLPEPPPPRVREEVLTR
ncbi:MAG TPA: cytochrome c biogenesis protein ResB [Candidatus Dormibacteraeota bacterium]|jgi:cytochrome c biogenesis protein ResB